MKKTLAAQLASDSRVAQAKALLLDVLGEYQNRLTGVQPPDPDLVKSYETKIKEFGALRGGPLFYPYLGSGFGRGSLVELADGSVKYDFISGIGVHHWGHANSELVAAALDAALQDITMQGNLQQNEECLGLAKALLAGANAKGSDLKHCFFSTSGAMANENALKIIFQKKYPADRILAFEHCFAGRSLAMAQVTDKPDYREGLPSVLSVDYVPFHDSAHPDESTRRSVKVLQRHLDRYPGRHAGMIFELVLGEGGFHVGSREFFASLMEVLKERGVAVMADEIQTFGRTTELFAFQHFGLDKFVDVVTLGKCFQVCATLFSDEYAPKPGLLSQTFTGGTAQFFAAGVILRGLTEGGFFGPHGKIAQFHHHFESRLKEMQVRHPKLIAGPFGIGAMIAFTPFEGRLNKVKQFVQALFEAGVISFYAGNDPARVRFLIPVGAVTFDDIDAVVRIVENTLVRTFSS
jgi:4-aminobutyrate aminotransferase-like enzyme